MNITVPRWLIVGLAALFSAYHLLLAGYSIGYAAHPGPVYAAMALYAVVTVASLWPGTGRMPIWVAVLNVAVSIAMTLLVSSELDPTRPGGNGYATWYVAAVGTLMTITSTRRRHAFAWVGIAFLAVQSVLWSGPGALGALGVVGSAAWVAVAHLLSRAIEKAGRDSQRFALAEREATEWQAAQEAHLYERRFRLGQTSSMAMAMLRTIQESGGNLTDEQRQECLNLEGAIRDEIRGRNLLNDAVRREVMSARRRGAAVMLYDEGGLEDLPDAERERVLDALAAAIEGTAADRIIARTVPEGASDVAITVVGLRTPNDPLAAALGTDEEDEVDLWLEIPRSGEAHPAR